VSKSSVGHLPSSAVADCLSQIKKLNLGLTEAEMIQVANLAPESDVELYLVIFIRLFLTL
jgi:hypothetical protein